MAYSTHCSTHQVQQRYEDAVVVDQVPSEVDPRSFAVWAVFDGHNGDTVSRYLAENVVAELERCLPATLPPCEDLQHSPSAQQYLHADCVRKAVLAAFLTFAVHVRDVVQHGGSDVRSRGFYSGSTATVAVQIGPLLTVANVGNTKCVLDVGHTAFECTSDHKLGNNEDEEERLDAIGARVSRLKFDLSGPAGPTEEGCGPLRLWPGGLHMSRAIGDGDCGQAVIPHPHIQQVWLPLRASRMIIATGGVWEAFDTFQKAVDALRDVSLPNAAAALLRRSLQHKQHLHNRGDMSVLVVDFVPEWCTEFRSQVRLDRSSCASSRSNHSSSHSLVQTNSPKRKAAWSQQQGSGSTSPVLAASKVGRYHMQQQQPQLQQPSGVLHRLLCVAAPTVTDAGGAGGEVQSPAGRALQQVPSFGCSSGVGSSTNVSSNHSSSRSFWRASSWRRRPVLAAEARLHYDDSSTVRAIAKCDTFQAYFKGQYQPLQQQLTIIQRELASHVQLLEGQNWKDAVVQSDTSAGSRYQSYRRQSLGSGSGDGSNSGALFRRTSSDLSSSSNGCFQGGYSMALPLKAVVL